MCLSNREAHRIPDDWSFSRTSLFNGDSHMTQTNARKRTGAGKALLAASVAAAVFTSIALFVLNARTGRAQSTAERPKFEVASIKPSQSEDRRRLFDFKPDLLRAANVPVSRPDRGSLWDQELSTGGRPGLEQLGSLRYHCQATRAGENGSVESDAAIAAGGAIPTRGPAGNQRDAGIRPGNCQKWT